jgi:hypothetical protein
VVKGKGAEECSVAVMDAYPELSVMHSLSTSEIRLHIAINVVSRLNVVKEARSLSVEELWQGGGGCSVAVCTIGPPLVGASVMVVREPIEAHVLLPLSQVTETRSSLTRPPVFAALGLGSACPPSACPSSSEGSQRVQQSCWCLVVAFQV